MKRGGIKRLLLHKLLFHKEVEVRKGVLSRADEGTADKELPRKISKISKAFSRMIAAAVNQASAATWTRRTCILAGRIQHL